MDFGTNIYVRKDAGAAFLGTDVPLPSVTLVVDGPTTIAPFYMVLPTEGRDRVSVYLVWGWMAALSSPMVEATDMTAAQRTLLLTIACAYSAFLDLQPGVRAQDFEEMTRHLRDLAHKLQPLTPAESELQTLKQWLEARLPATAFTAIHDDDFVIPDPVASSEPRQKNLVANLVAMLNPAIVDSVANVAAQTSTSTPSPPSASRARKDRRRRAKQRAAAAASASVDSSSTPAPAPLSPPGLLPPRSISLPTSRVITNATALDETTPTVIDVSILVNDMAALASPLAADLASALGPTGMSTNAALHVPTPVIEVSTSAPVAATATLAGAASASTGDLSPATSGVPAHVNICASAATLDASTGMTSVKAGSAGRMESVGGAGIAGRARIETVSVGSSDSEVEESDEDSDSAPPSLRTVVDSSDFDEESEDDGDSEDSE